MENIFKKEFEGLPIWGWLIVIMLAFAAAFGINLLTASNFAASSKYKVPTKTADCQPKSNGGFICEITQ